MAYKTKNINDSSSMLMAVLLNLLLIFFGGKTSLLALEATAELSAGYDDNVTLASTGTGSGFSLYRAYLSQPFSFSKQGMNGSGFAGATYQDYFEFSDNYQLEAGGYLSRPFFDGRISPGILYRFSMYRDDEFEEDEMNENSVGGWVDWHITRKYVIGIEQILSMQNYRNNLYGVSRDDDLSETSLYFSSYFFPAVPAHLVLTHSRRSSSLDYESYKENGISISTAYSPHSMWEVRGTAYWSRADYDDIEGLSDRADIGLGASFGVSFFIKKYEMFLQFDGFKNDSDIEEESYRRKVAQLGVSLSF